MKIRQNPTESSDFLMDFPHFDGLQQKEIWLPQSFLKFKLDNLIFGRIS